MKILAILGISILSLATTKNDGLVIPKETLEDKHKRHVAKLEMGIQHANIRIANLERSMLTLQAMLAKIPASEMPEMPKYSEFTVGD